MASNAQLTPMMAQYRRIKSELPKDALLLFRLGDFYELFFEDAQVGAQLLNVALTKRGVVPMCGIPFHAANAYIGRLLKAGRKVAICDQVEDARPGQLVKREVTQILSPGTHFDERMLKAERNNFLAAVHPVGRTFGLAFVDLTTGDFMTTEVEGDAEALTELQRLRPAELIYPGEAAAVRELLLGGSRGAVEEKKPLTPALSPSDGERESHQARGESSQHISLGGYGVWVDSEWLRRLGVCAGDGVVHGARAFQGRVAGRLRAEGSHGGHRGGGGGVALPDATPAARRGQPDPHFLLPEERLPGAGLHDAAASGNPGAAAP